jgi:hypothetical protein
MSLLQLTTSESAPRKVSILAGVIRKVNNKWILIEDAGHAPIGLKHEIREPNTKSIEVLFDKKYSKVLTCSITGDETYTTHGFSFGASCGLDKLIINHACRGVESTNSQLGIAGSNIWISVMMFD